MGQLLELAESACAWDEPATGQVQPLLEGLRDASDAPDALRTLGRRLLALLDRERDLGNLTQGPGLQLSLHLQILLACLEDKQRGQHLALITGMVPGILNGDAQAQQTAEELAAEIAEEDDANDSTRAFAVGSPILLAGERDPDLVTCGWEDNEGTAFAVRTALAGVPDRELLVVGAGLLLCLIGLELLIGPPYDVLRSNLPRCSLLTNCCN